MGQRGSPAKLEWGNGEEDDLTGGKTDQNAAQTSFAVNKKESDRGEAAGDDKGNMRPTNTAKSKESVVQPIPIAWMETDARNEHAHGGNFRETRDYLEEDHDEASRDKYTGIPKKPSGEEQ